MPGKHRRAKCKTPGCENDVRADCNKSGYCSVCFETFARKSGLNKQEACHALVNGLRFGPAGPVEPDGGLAAAAQAALPPDPVEASGKVSTWAERKCDLSKLEHLIGNWMLVNDLHIPLHDSLLLTRMLKAARLNGVFQLCLGGDVFEAQEQGMFAKNAPSGMDPAEAAQRVMQVLAALAAHFRRIVILKGNHDARWQKTLERLLSAPDGRQLAELLGVDLSVSYRDRYVALMDSWTRLYAADAAGRIEWLGQPAVEIDGPAGCKPYLYCHPKTYSRLAPNAERRIAAVKEQPVLGTHGHLFALGVSPSGKYPVAQVPACTDPAAHLYLHERVTDFPHWSRGFAMVKAGVVRIWVDNPYLTDWGELERAYAASVATA